MVLNPQSVNGFMNFAMPWELLFVANLDKKNDINGLVWKNLITFAVITLKNEPS